MILSVSGTPGSGKTSVSKFLAEKLGMAFYSVGGIRGKMAEERGMTIDELNALGEQEGFTDKDVDRYQEQLGKQEDNFVIEGRLSWYFIPHSFKIYLTCDLDEAARRIYEARKHPEEGRGDERPYESLEDAKRQIEKRMASDMKRYEKYYSIDYRDPSHYDLVLDTTEAPNAAATAKRIIRELQERRIIGAEA